MRFSRFIGTGRILHWAEPESNRRHKDFQSFALPAELSARRAKQFTIPRPKLQVYSRFLRPGSCRLGLLILL